ncbi:MAG TPA: peptidoglycan DD-metalloendopeptidase family protein [Spirochaetota bacterium]|nr:peptidoglycan DD-metalloendopeptidase family protein [Spirochaetota bacterium]HPC42128.1 peptidoglycan DD-metalloendopeptidase family protein [Spirochaetota bacterium]HPL18075.1 peptidoglycan DD-metalloendopeptidase family protein [Spirochaetota bacterium]HQF09700.1 peptidoglycan DD-metalloendopeptidase family protein [Spirochaetota bacterium]HQH98422.1 peptidoglycan DD-metalloendopeptidase family protein [Spirochaetota bacterium]
MKKITVILALATAISACFRCSSIQDTHEAYSDITAAVVNNDTEEVRNFLSRGFNTNHRFMDGWTLLHIAARWDTYRVVTRCFDDSNGKRTGIFTVTQKTEDESLRAREMVSLLLDRGGDANMKADDGSTPLHIVLASLQYTSPDIPSIPPVEGRVSSRFGWRGSPFDNNSDYHRALDIAAKNGTPVRATANGVVAMTGVSSTLGNYIIIQHRNGYQSIYGHCHLFAVKKNSPVRRGAIIGYVGMTGSASGDHCHYEVRLNGAPVNPIEFVNGKIIGETQHAIAMGVVEQLLSKKIQVDARTNDGRTPLIEAAAKSSALSRLLIDQGADINAADENGITPLHMAAAGDAELVRVLLRKGARVNPRTRSSVCAIAGTLFAQGTTPLAVALKYGNSATAELLKGSGAVE